MTTATDSLQEETRILLLVRREQDRNLLADHFSTDHEVLLGHPGEEWPAFDACLVDSAWYGEVADALRERRAAAEPVYLPVLLLVQGEVGDALSAADDALFDDVLGLPASRKELDARVDSALRARELSLDLEERRDELALYRHAMDEADIGITIADARDDQPLVYVNDGFCEVTGYDREEAMGRNCRFLQGPDTDEEPVAEMRRAIETEEPTTVELRNYRADGECFWNEVSIAPVEDEAGNVTHYIGFQRDVTERRERVRELEDARLRLQLAVEGSELSVWEVDYEAGVTTFEAGEKQHFGIENETLSIEEFYEHVHPEDRERVREAFERGREEGSVRVEYRIRRPDTGEVRWIENIGEFQYEDGEVVRCVGTGRDITEQKQREQELERYEAIVEAAPDPIVAYDTGRRITLANEELADAFDVPYGRLVGAHASEVFSEETGERVNDLIRTMLSEERDQGTIEVEYGDPSRLFEASMALLRDEDGEYRGSVGVARDITDLREHEQRLSVLDRVLRHNLRNKMNVVLGYSRHLLDADDPVVREAAQVITDAGEELLGLSESARRFHETMEEGAAERTELDIAERVRDVVDELRLEHPDASFALDLPESARVRVSEGVELALNEILENAVDHCDRDPEVEVTVTTEGDDVVVRVADNGPGIEPQERRALELDAERPLEHASGLGLWLVRWTVDASGGTVTIEEREPRGAVVELRFDAASAE